MYWPDEDIDTFTKHGDGEAENAGKDAAVQDSPLSLDSSTADYPTTTKYCPVSLEETPLK